jgi:disulfide bond formation protein DsbB
VETETVTLFLALLAVAAEVAVVVTLVLLAAGRRATVRENLAPQALALAAVVAVVATLGSLYFSEVAHFTPCKLCWYQRIAMYPLAPMLVLAAVRRDVGFRVYGMVAAAIGIAISSYHVLLERYPTLESSVCDPTNPCTLIWVKRFGYLTIPGMALSGFALILVLLAVARPEEP